jgi:biotin carboxyl carrier protein
MFVTTIAVTAIIVDAATEEATQEYYYDQGLYYIKQGDGYVVVQAPPGVTVKELPKEKETVVVNETTNNYYYSGNFYEKSKDGYTVVEPMAGSVVEKLPEGGQEVKVGDMTYVKVGETYYQPIKRDGKDMYEVVNVTKEE